MNATGVKGLGVRVVRSVMERNGEWQLLGCDFEVPGKLVRVFPSVAGDCPTSPFLSILSKDAVRSKGWAGANVPRTHCGEGKQGTTTRRDHKAT